ncbi:polysaccharide deacetylase family protein [Sphingomonas sp. PR090111-T3T-6A]|uniref:polysaccharide deacetylase family protein n=1 Tax=Sphingomonas sp. PR090111-T3T-6A TaxID=685778 RepID=UPI00035FC7F7|nr:hypothetical protein [Sphingomonas sp. PR090111-T3T-6A]
MTHVLISVDTELSAGRRARGQGVRENFESSILGRCPAGDFGIGWQMDCLDHHGLKGVFFVDPMPALVHGEQVVADIVGPIRARGHEVQLHIHTEWLRWANSSPVAGRLGHNIGDFDLDDQTRLLSLARDLLVRAGAPQPIAFRAGNYGADDNSLRALAALGVAWDTSVNPAYLGGDCRISVAQGQVGAVEKEGVSLLPVSGFFDRPRHFRPAQICAASGMEMRAALLHAAETGQPAFVIVTHSFEMLSRDRQRPNRSVMARFDSMCRTIADHPSLRTSGFADLDRSEVLGGDRQQERLPANLLRTGLRFADQLIGTWRYERQVLPG